MRARQTLQPETGTPWDLHRGSGCESSSSRWRLPASSPTWSHTTRRLPNSRFSDPRQTHLTAPQAFKLLARGTRVTTAKSCFKMLGGGFGLACCTFFLSCRFRLQLHTLNPKLYKPYKLRLTEPEDPRQTQKLRGLLPPKLPFEFLIQGKGPKPARPRQGHRKLRPDCEVDKSTASHHRNRPPC